MTMTIMIFMMMFMMLDGPPSTLCFQQLTSKNRIIPVVFFEKSAIWKKLGQFSKQILGICTESLFDKILIVFAKFHFI